MDLRKQVLLGMTPDERVTFMLKVARMHLERLEKQVRDSGYVSEDAKFYRRLLLKGFRPDQARRHVDRWRKYGTA